MAVFEAKTASAYKQDVWEEGIPAPYIMQVQHYMAVTGAIIFIIMWWSGTKK